MLLSVLCLLSSALVGSMSISLSQTAAARIGGYLREQPKALGLRFGVKRSGCTGFAYVVDITDQQKADDRVFESRGIRILVDPDSLPVVAGTEIDFVQQGLNQNFVFRNPNTTAECGCGESFSAG
ncbi:MAG: HesB/IscA family protein [Lysobacterales bacterium]